MVKVKQQKQFITKFKAIMAGETIDEKLELLHAKIIKGLEMEIKSIELKAFALDDELFEAERQYDLALLNKGSFQFSLKDYLTHLRNCHEKVEAKYEEIAENMKHVKFLKNKLAETKK